MRLLTSAVFDCILLFVILAFITEIAIPALRDRALFPSYRWLMRLLTTPPPGTPKKKKRRRFYQRRREQQKATTATVESRQNHDQ
jgi:hypothetical protein